ncbi:Gibberellin 2-beta-dioxygenase [Platanthera zijinensis]|uniref:gibberellin 2beta-dioxygenase n=1 Tax=Platanthera zijinensis TaxID=2320716 RepID=A0AAP0BHQ6_9ASPA
MVVLANPSPDETFLLRPSKPCPSFPDTPAVDLSTPAAARDIVSASAEFGFFKVTNHGVSKSLISNLEAAAVEFFALPDVEKEKAVLANSFGYGNREIGRNGDVGWLEYLLLEVAENSPMLLPFLKEPLQSSFCCALKEYVLAMKKLATGVLELMADGLGMEQRNVFGKYINEEKSDSFFRLNHYPPCPMLQVQGFNRTVNGFGEHTDPQIISVMRSTNSDGLEIALRDGSWVSIPPDRDSFFVNVGDSLQVLTNGRFRSVRHRVVTTGVRSRLSMIYFGGPPPCARISPADELLAEDRGRSKYTEFTWADYKAAAFKSRLADNRLRHFENHQ